MINQVQKTSLDLPNNVIRNKKTQIVKLNLEVRNKVNLPKMMIQKTNLVVELKSLIGHKMKMDLGSIKQLESDGTALKKKILRQKINQEVKLRNLKILSLKTMMMTNLIGHKMRMEFGLTKRLESAGMNLKRKIIIQIVKENGGLDQKMIQDRGAASLE